MRRLHLVVGLVGVVGFLASGAYMHLAHDHLRGMDDTRRLLFRSTHIYLLLTSLLNLALGLNLTTSIGWRWWLQLAGSGLLVAAPVLAAVGFIVEPWLPGLDRPYSPPGIYASLAGLLLHTVSRISRSRSRPPSEEQPISHASE